MRSVLLALACLASFEAPASELDELLSAAISLKQAHVARSYERCRSHGRSDTVCRDALNALHPREISALARLAEHLVNVDETELSGAMASCYDPSHDYQDLIECWERLATHLDQEQEIVLTKQQSFQLSDLPSKLSSLDPLERKSLVLCVRAAVKTNFKETVAHNLQAGGAEATWALKVSALESYFMIDVARAAGWAEMKEYYSYEARDLEALIRNKIDSIEYRQAAKRNERRLASALAPETSRQSLHASNFSKLSELCDDVATAVIGKAKVAASQ